MSVVRSTYSQAEDHSVNVACGPPRARVDAVPHDVGSLCTVEGRSVCSGRL